jgi:hypothetical protein
MKHERAVRHEGLVAAATWAAHRRGQVVLRAEVMPQVGGVLEPHVAVGAEIVLVAIVFLELLIVVE